MKSPLVLFVFAAMPACATTVTCAAIAPPEWGLPSARLETVSVVSYPANEIVAEDDTRWAMVPIVQVVKAGKLHQTWNMNFDAPKYVFKIDCFYFGTPRFLRINAADVKRCDAIWDMRKQKVVPGSVAFHCQ